MICLGIFSNEASVFERFEIEKEPGVNILLAWYEYECCSGSAFVLYEKDGGLFEVNASHCSCHGPEEQWKPEETTIEALRYRMTKGTLGQVDSYYEERNFADKLEQTLKEFEQKNQ